MARSAHITSVDAVRRLRAALLQFQEAMADALTMLEMEARRPVEWIESDRARYWPREVRKASDGVQSARINLERCEIAIRPDDKRSCYDEKKAFEKAKQRLRLSEAKVQAVRKWRVIVKKEVDEFLVQISKVRWYMDSDFLRAVAAVERMSEALDSYLQQAAPPSQILPGQVEEPPP